MLHGWGANAKDLASLTPRLFLIDFQIIFPHTPFPHLGVPEGKTW